MNHSAAAALGAVSEIPDIRYNIPIRIVRIRAIKDDLAGTPDNGRASIRHGRRIDRHCKGIAVNAAG